MQQYVWLFKNRLFGVARANAFQLDVEHHVFCLILKQINDDHQYPDDPFVALADFNIILEKARQRTVHELPRKAPRSLGAKFLTASTALRACRNRHLGTLMRCCEAWEPVGKCFDPNSFRCIDFHGLSQIIASITREKSRRKRSRNWKSALDTDGKRQCPWQSAGLDVAPGAPRNPCSAFTLLPMKTVTLWKTKTNLAGMIFQARNEGERHHHFETILRYVQKGPDDIRWEIDRNEFDELISTKKESASGPDGIPKSLYRCAGRFVFAVSLQRIQTCPGGWRYLCAIC